MRAASIHKQLTHRVQRLQKSEVQRGRLPEARVVDVYEEFSKASVTRKGEAMKAMDRAITKQLNL